MAGSAPVRSGQLSDTERAALAEMLRDARDLVQMLERKLGLRRSDDSHIHPIAALRKDLGLTQRDLARAVGISAPALNRIEHRPGFSGKQTTRRKIAEVLGISEDLLSAVPESN